MSWAVGEFEGRDIGYGVPAICDHPECDTKINRGLGYVCGWGEPYGGQDGCGRFFCPDHGGEQLCERCRAGQPPFDPKPDVPEWVEWKLTDDSWGPWRDQNPDRVKQMQAGRAGTDLGERPRQVVGDPITAAQADEFAAVLGIDPEEIDR